MVDEIEVDPVGVEASQAGLHLQHDVPAGKTTVINAGSGG